MREKLRDNQGKNCKVIGIAKIVNKLHPFGNVTIGQNYHVVGESNSHLWILDNELRQCQITKKVGWAGIQIKMGEVNASVNANTGN